MNKTKQKFIINTLLKSVNNFTPNTFICQEKKQFVPTQWMTYVESVAESKKIN